jgi:hypothetical protein
MNNPKKMKMYPKWSKYGLATLLFPVSFVLAGQTIKDTLESQTVEVVKSYTPSVPDADKIDVNPPLTGQEEFNKFQLDYTPLEIEAVSTFETEKGKLVRPYVHLENREEKPGFLELAVGNRQAFLLNTFYSYRFDNDWKSGGRLQFGSLGKNKTDTLQLNPFSTFDLRLFAGHTGENVKWDFRSGYRRMASVWRDTLTPFSALDRSFAYHRLSAGANMQLFRTVLRGSGLDYVWLSGTGEDEHNLKFLSHFDFPLAGFSIRTLMDIQWVSGTAGGGYNNFQAGLYPAFNLEKERFLFRLGFKLFYQNRGDVNDNFLFYPGISVEYNMIPELLTLYFSYQGSVETQSYNRLLEITRYVRMREALKPTSVPYHFFGGFRGSVGTRTVYELKLGMAKEKNSPFLTLRNLPGGLALIPVYDDMEYFYFNVNLSYVAGRNFETKIRFRYNQFTPETLPKAWNKPDYKLSWLMRFHIGKFTWANDLFYIGPRYDLIGQSQVKTGEIVDLNLKWSYRVLKNLDIYLDGRNLLNRNDLIYYAYPSQGLHILAGVYYVF